MLIMMNGDNKMNVKRNNVRIIRIILDLHGVIVDSRKVVLFEYGTSWKLQFSLSHGIKPFNAIISIVFLKSFVFH